MSYNGNQLIRKANVKMDHVVYLDSKANELQKLIDGTKSMIIRGATGRKLPYGRVNPGDVLYFINNDAELTVKCRAIVKSVENSEKMSPDESVEMIQANMEKLNLSDEQTRRWSGKRYLVLIAIKDFEEISPFKIDKSAYGNMDDWLPVERIDSVKI